MDTSSGGSRISRRGGRRPRRGRIDSRGSYVSKILYVETKESGPLGGVRRNAPWILFPCAVVNSACIVHNCKGNNVMHVPRAFAPNDI